MGGIAGIVNDILEEVKEKADKACQMVAKETGDEIQDAYNESVENFYSAYSPSVYKRTESTYKASTGRHGRRWWRMGEMHYKFGIKVDPGLMGEPYNVGNHGWAKHGVATAAFVFGRTWDQGIHGFTRDYFMMMNSFREQYDDPWIISKKDEFFKNGKRRGAVGFWEFRRKQGRALPTNSTPPSIIMDRKTRNILNTIYAKVDKYFDL